MMKHKKWIRSLLSFLTILCCLAGSITPVFASGTGSDVPRVTFTNEPRNSPDLYVTKTVENALEGAEYEAPEHAVFRFVLKLNGEVAGNVPYRVLDPVHGEIIRKTSGTLMEIPFQTDRTGVFTLEAGQQAWFEGLGTGTRYEVLEQDTYLRPVIDANEKETVDDTRSLWSVQYNEDGTRTETRLEDAFVYVCETRSLAADGWQKKSPSGGSSGEHSILVNGSDETFVNRYIGKGDGTMAVLQISKSTSFPEGYQAPDSTPAFPFVIELEGKPYANEPFTAVNDRTGETRSMTTDGDGRFSLPGGWTASFENVPANVDYRVYEDTEAGKRPVETPPEEIEIRDNVMSRNMDSETRDGQDPAPGLDSDEAAPQTAADSGQETVSDPENAQAEEEPSGDDGNSEPSGTEPYEADPESEPLGGNLSRQSLRMTSQSSLPQGGQIQRYLWPADWWPTDESERTGSVQAPLTALDFHNANVSFVVTKRLEDYTNDGSVFTFRLADEDNNALDGVLYYVYNTDGEPVYSASQRPSLDAVTVNGQKILTGRTGQYDSGMFTLQPGQAAVFIGLKPGISYRVTEVKNPNYTQVLPLPTEDTLHTVPSNGQISTIDFVNRPENPEGSLTVTKNVTYDTLEGELSQDEFHFILYRRQTEEEVRTLLGIDEDEEITSKKIIEALKDDKIVLTEAPTNAGTEIPLPPSILLSLDSEARTDQPGEAVSVSEESGSGTSGLPNQTSDAAEVTADQIDTAAGQESAQSGGLRMKAAVRTASAASGRVAKNTDTWTCTIDGTAYAVYAPAEGMLFEIPEGLEAPTYKTGPYAQAGWSKSGEFALKAGQTARFEDKVSAGDEYLVREIGLSEEYQELSSSMFWDEETEQFVEALMYGYQRGYEADPETEELKQTFLAQAGTVRSSSEAGEWTPAGLALMFRNIYTPKKIDLVLTKTDGDNKPITNREAHFMLYRTRGQDGPVLPDILEDGTVPDPDTFVYTTENGVLTIRDLKAGIYWLYELKAPSGYCLLPEPVEIDLTWTEDGLTVTIDGKPYKVPEDEGEVKSEVLGSISITDPVPIPMPEPDPDEREDDGSDVSPMSRMNTGSNIGGSTMRPLETNTEVHLGIRNTELYELPSTGGIGIYWYSIGGTLLMLAAALILYKYQRRGRC